MKKESATRILAFAIILSIVIVSLSTFVPTGNAIKFLGMDYNKGTLVVTSMPSGASLYLGNSNTGQVTPYERKLEPGTYKMRLVKDGYRENVTVFQIQKRKTTRINVELLKIEFDSYVPPSIQKGVASLGNNNYSSLFEQGYLNTVDIKDKLTDFDNFGNTIGPNRLAKLKDSEINIKKEFYDYHEEIAFNGISPSLETGLTYDLNRDEEWKEKVFIAMPEQSISYYYKLDENLRIGHRFIDATRSRPINITFLGQNLQILGATSNSIIIKYCTTRCQIKIYNDGDAYIGEDNNDPIWEWDLAGLDALDASQVRLGITLSLGIDSPTENDNPLVNHPLYPSNYLCMPNDYICFLFEKMTQEDNQFNKYKISDEIKDLYVNQNAVYPIISNARVLSIKSENTRNLNNSGLVAGGWDTGGVYIYLNRSGLSLFREHTTGKAVLFNTYLFNNPVNNRVAMANNVFQLDYGSTNINMDIAYRLTSNYNDRYKQGGLIILDSLSNSTSLSSNDIVGILSGYSSSALNDGDLVIYFTNSTENQITYLGHSDSNTMITNDLRYMSNNDLIDISAWEENTRTKDGIIIYDPIYRALSDKIEFSIPPNLNNYEAVIRVTYPKD